MKLKTTAYIWIVIAALVAVWVGTAVLAQQGPGGPGQPGGPGFPGGPGMQPPMGSGPIMKTGTQGVFVLLGPTLKKYDAALREQGSLQLINPPINNPNPPADGARRPPMQPMQPGAVLLVAPAAQGASEKVIAIFGDQVISVDAASLKIAAKAKLPDLQSPRPPDGAMGNPQGPGMMPPFFGPPPAIELQGRILYFLRGPQIVGVNVDDGTIAGPAMLGKPQPPTGD